MAVNDAVAVITETHGHVHAGDFGGRKRDALVLTAEERRWGGRGGVGRGGGAAWLALLQFADGLFPAGGFAHSFGLETYVQEGVVRDRADLEAFVSAHLEGSAGPADAVAAACAVRQAAAADVAGWVTLDERLEA